jgi:nicotinamide-nucleotide amidase
VRAEIVAVGDELLLGEATDTNSAWLSARLAELGVRMSRHVTVADVVDDIAGALREACGRADVVLVSGGLGPTQDDVTRHAVAAVAGVALQRRTELEEYLRDYFARAGREMPERNLVQAELPVGARVLPAVGTAAGFAVDVGAATVYCLPGVPHEMRAMFDAEVVPALLERGDLEAIVSRVVRTGGLAEAAVADLCAPLVERLAPEGNPTVAFLASSGETRVRLTARADTPAAAHKLLAPLVAELLDRLGPGVTGVDDEGVEFSVARMLRAAGWTLALGESITGGGVAARLVTVHGASDWFRGGLVTYATDTKGALAGVDPALLDEHGPVSEPAAAALAGGARERLDADVGLGIVGVAGPTTQGGAPVGTVCVGVSFAGAGERTRTVRLPVRGRAEIQRFAASVALDYLRRRLAEVLG